MQLAQIAVNCNAAEKALLADVTEAHPDASYVELLRLFKVRRSTRSAHAALCQLRGACANLLAAAAPDPLFGSTLFVCLFGCLFVCLFVCDGPLRNTPLMARPTPHARRRVVMAYSRFAAQERAVRALVRRRPPRRAIATQPRYASATAYA